MTSSVNLNQLLGSAGMDAHTTQALQLTADTLGPAIMAGLGPVQLDDITTSEVVLVKFVIDDSGSIRFGSNAQMVRDGHNLVLSSLKGSKQSAAVLVGCDLLNTGALYPFNTLDNAQRLDSHNYNPSGGTPLYFQTEIALAGVVAKLAEFEQGGVAARAIVVIITDGADNRGMPAPSSLKTVVKGMLATEQVIIAGMGIDDGYTDFNAVFGDMGILPEWILTPGNSEHEIRAAFRAVSQSAVRASQTAASFSQTAMGGFGGTP